MRIKLLIFLWMIITFTGISYTDQRYRYSFETRVDSHGTILLIIHYRIFFQGYAEIDLIKKKTQNKNSIFMLDSIQKSGYMARTLGFFGKKLGVFTANPKNADFFKISKEIKESILKNEQYYAQFIKKSIFYPYHIKPLSARGNGFARSIEGIQSHSNIKIPIVYSNQKIKIKTYFKIYDILSNSLEFYNHSFLPKGSREISHLKTGANWRSEKIDFTKLLNITLIKTAKIMELILPFKQEKDFYVEYSVIKKTDKDIIIRGIAEPNITVWRDYEIKFFRREINYNFKAGTLLYDNCTVKISDKDGKGGYAKASLRLVN